MFSYIIKARELREIAKCLHNGARIMIKLVNKFKRGKFCMDLDGEWCKDVRYVGHVGWKVP